MILPLSVSSQTQLKTNTNYSLLQFTTLSLLMASLTLIIGDTVRCSSATCRLILDCLSWLLSAQMCQISGINYTTLSDNHRPAVSSTKQRVSANNHRKTRTKLESKFQRESKKALSRHRTAGGVHEGGGDIKISTLHGQKKRFLKEWIPISLCCGT